MAKGSESFGLGWADKLPTPTVKDSTASYDLGSGQTLSVTALAQGFSENLKLTQQPDDDAVSYRIPLNLDGLKLSQADSGHLLLKNSDGDLVAEAPAPMMWDASKDEASGESANREQVSTKIETASDGAQTLVLTPDKDFLATATYPVTVDPTSTLAVTTDTWVQNPDYPDSQVSSQELKSGTYDGGTDTARSYLKFDVAKFAGEAHHRGDHVAVQLLLGDLLHLRGRHRGEADHLLVVLVVDHLGRAAVDQYHGHGLQHRPLGLHRLRGGLVELESADDHASVGGRLDQLRPAGTRRQ